MKTTDLYNPADYPVVIGRGQKAALCTVWNPATAATTANGRIGLVERLPELLDLCAIIGTLYSRTGIAAVIRNLALAKDITALYIWDHGSLSRSSVGRSGIEVLRALWKDRIHDDGTVIGTSYKLEPEIDPAFVRELISKIALVEVGDTDDSRLVDVIAADQATGMRGAERAARSFPAPKPVVVDQWPAELVGHLVHDRTIFGAWLKVVRDVMRYGVDKSTQHGMPARELVGFNWVITHGDSDHPAIPADWPTEIATLTGSSAEAIAGYLPTILTADHGITTYGLRLRAYPISPTETLDQIASVLVRCFTESHDSRRAVATTMIPSLDWNSTEPPCLTHVQCLQSGGKLIMLASFRSHDIYKGALLNAIALRHLQQQIAGTTGFDLGALHIHSASAHIYKHDWPNAQLTARCAFTDRAPKLGLPDEAVDPRGNMIISVADGKVCCSLRTDNGIELWKYADASTAKIRAKIAQLGLIVDPTHLMYIGHELARADIAIASGQPFVQL